MGGVSSGMGGLRVPETAGCPACHVRNDASFRQLIRTIRAADGGDWTATWGLAARAARIGVTFPDRDGFAAWLSQVDKQVERIAGVARAALPDWCWFDAYRAGLMPHEGAHFALEDAVRGAGSAG